MASSYTSLVLGALLLMSCVSWGSATVYTVGDSQGWGFNVNYSTWASGGKKFAVGDQLVFNYQSNQHTVTEVSSSDYNSCSASNPISSTSTGPTTITLNTAGSHYYICGISGHCSAGMKLAVSVATPSSSPSTPTPTPPATPTTPSTPTTPTTPSTPTATAPSTPTAASPSNSHSGAAAGLVPTVSAVAAIAGLVAMLF